MPFLRLKCPKCLAPVLEVQIDSKEDAIKHADPLCSQCGTNAMPMDKMLHSWAQVEAQMKRLRDLEAQGLIKIQPIGTPGTARVTMTGNSNESGELQVNVIQPPEPTQTRH